MRFGNTDFECMTRHKCPHCHEQQLLEYSCMSLSNKFEAEKAELVECTECRGIYVAKVAMTKKPELKTRTYRLVKTKETNNEA